MYRGPPGVPGRATPSGRAMDEPPTAPLPRLFWRRVRCEACGRLFELPPESDALPAHSPRHRDAAGARCPGRDGIPA